IEIAMAGYWEDGPAGLGVNELCRRAGISKPGLYRDFGGEDGLMLAALDRYRQTILERLYVLLSSKRPFPDVLQGLVTWYTSDRGLPPGCLFSKLRTSPKLLGPATTARIATLRDELRDAYEVWYRRAVARHEANKAVPPDLAAYVLDVQLTHVTLLMAAGEPPDLVRAQAELALAGLLTSGQER
ncbi:MAG: TetR/AcrR family transcriptional regulator, partial [Bacteroidota bacterium]